MRISAKLIFLITLSLSIVCCTNHTKEEGNIRIDISDAFADSIDISDFVDSITYIDLNTAEDNPVGYIKNARINDYLIVTNERSNHSPVKLFDIKGNFIANIGRIGQGPGEYFEASAVDINQNTVYVYDMIRGAASMYDTSGRYLGKDSIGYGYDFAVTMAGNQKRYLLANYNTPLDDMAGVFLVNSSPFSSRRILDQRDKAVDINRFNEFSINDGIIHTMTGDFEFKSMRLDNDSLVCEYDFDIQPVPTQSEIDNWTRGADTYSKHFIRTAYEDTGRWIIMHFSKIDNYPIVLFDKTNGTYKAGGRFCNTIDSTRNFYFFPTITNGALLGCSSAEGDENPRLMFAHLKK